MKVGKTTGLQRGWLLGAAGGAIALVMLGFGVSRLVETRQAQVASSAEESPVALPQRVEVAALGRLEPEGEVIRVGGPSTERLARLTVQQGDTVQTGQVLAYLDSYEERKAERDLAASQLAEAQRRLRNTTTVGQAQVQEAQTRLRQVQAPGQAELAAQEARIRESEAELAQEEANLVKAQQDLQRFTELVQQGAVSQQQADNARTTYEATLARRNAAQQQIQTEQATLVRIRTQWQEDIRNAQAEVRSQQANVPLSQTQVAVESARQNLALAEARLERTIIRAPQAGRVLRIITRGGEVVSADGILDLGNTSQMYVVAEVYETDVGLVQRGQPATISSRNGAFSDTLTGKVSEIGWQIFKNNVLDDDPAANADARVVEVKIRLDDSKPVEALTNLQVDVRIDVR